MINNISSPLINFCQYEASQKDQSNVQSRKKKLLDKFETEVKNSADMNDTIQVPRTIFKGYLAFMVSTTLVTLSSFINKKHNYVKNGMNIASALTALWGTYSFVRPYLIRDEKKTK